MVDSTNMGFSIVHCTKRTRNGHLDLPVRCAESKRLGIVTCSLSVRCAELQTTRLVTWIHVLSHRWGPTTGKAFLGSLA